MPPEQPGNRLISAGAILLLGFAIALPAAAQTEEPSSRAKQTSDQGEEPPLVVESNEMVIKDAEQRAVYTGDVKATKGDMVLRSDRLVVHYNKNGIQRAHATGDPVRMVQGDRRGHSQEAFYDASDRSLLMVGNAYLEEGPNTLEGARIRYFMDQRRTEVYSDKDGGETRARAVFHPGNPPGGEGSQGDAQADEGQGGDSSPGESPAE